MTHWEREEAASMDAEGKLRAEKQKAEASAHAKEALEATRASSAREQGAEGDEARANDALQKLTKPKAG